MTVRHRPDGSDRPEVVVSIGRVGPHVTPVLCGLTILHLADVISMRFEAARDPSRTDSDSILRLEGRGARIVFDVQDHDTLLPNEISWATHYFKRSMPRGSTAPVRPLGLNVTVALPPWSVRLAVAALRAATSPGEVRGALTTIVGHTDLPRPWLPRDSEGRPVPYSAIEAGPAHGGDGVVLVARTWDPDRVDGNAVAMRRRMNEVRVGTVRALRTRFGDHGLIGLVPTPHARLHHPDLVLDPRATTRAAYIRRMRRAAVCVTSTGLRDSTGWRMGEFVSASRPIVTEPLAHAVPGGFAAGTNYLEYRDPSTVVAEVEKLLDEPTLRASMRRANHRHYRRHLRPDALVRRALEAAGVLDAEDDPEDDDERDHDYSGP